jgi:hypothetical protein
VPVSGRKVIEMAGDSMIEIKMSGRERSEEEEGEEPITKGASNGYAS